MTQRQYGVQYLVTCGSDTPQIRLHWGISVANMPLKPVDPRVDIGDGVCVKKSSRSGHYRSYEMRKFGAVLLAYSLIASNAYAATDAAAPLAAGKPAGVKQAQMAQTGTLLLVVGLGAVAAGIALVASGNGHSIVSATNTCTDVACSATSTTSTTSTKSTTSTTTTTSTSP